MDKKIPFLIISLIIIFSAYSLYFSQENEPLLILQNTENKLELPKGILVAMAHVESNLDPRAVSPKGAKGILQITDITAKEAAQKIGLKDYDIFNIKDNALIGGFVLKKNLKRFKGDLHLALAAYNAGPTRTRKWVKKGKGLPGRELINAFAYKETKNYVHKVIRIWKKNIARKNL